MVLALIIGWLTAVEERGGLILMMMEGPGLGLIGNVGKEE